MTPLARRSRTRSDIPKAWVRAGRILLVINLLVLMVSGFTERLWTWDRFLRGGQDFELSLLALLAFFCLILVFAQYFRRRVSELLDCENGDYVIRDLPNPLPRTPTSLLSFCMERPPGPAQGLSSVILRI